MRLLQKIFLTIPLLFLVLSCSKDDDDDPVRFNLAVTITPSDGGTVSPSSGTYDEGTVVNLEGTPTNGYSFVEWTGSIQSTENPVAVTMDSDKDITGVFEKLDADGDGVTDDIDSCADTPNGETVDANGCADSQKDTDEDGVTDDIDLCGNTRADLVVDENGCPNPSPIYQDANGITIKCHDWSQVGDTGQYNNITYTIVDENMLRQMVENEEDVTKVCTTKVTNMSELFSDTLFNQDIGSWDVSHVTDMSGMFSANLLFTDPNPFNQDISHWDVSSVTDMSGMFFGALFNQDINSWNVSSITNMNLMFSSSQFNQEIGSWDVSMVTNMSGMFLGSSFNQPIGIWDVSSVSDMSGMFLGSPFNQPIGNWDVSNVTKMGGMFELSSFNQDISSWNVGNVTDMSGMFEGSVFNQDIGSWDVGNVNEMNSMFQNSNFNQDLSGWDVESVVLCIEFSENSPQWILPKPNFANCNPN